MLILTRGLGETIKTGNDIEVFITSIHGNQVKVGVKAPRDAPIHREEIATAMAAQAHHSPGGITH